MAASLIAFTICCIVFGIIGFLLTLFGLRFLYRSKLISLEDCLYLIKIKALALAGALVVVWLIGFIVILIIK